MAHCEYCYGDIHNHFFCQVGTVPTADGWFRAPCTEEYQKTCANWLVINPPKVEPKPKAKSKKVVIEETFYDPS